MALAESETMTPHQALAANGKSFNWARRFLGRRMGEDAATLYRFCRVLDDMAVGDMSNGPHRLLTIRDDLAANRRATHPHQRGIINRHRANLSKHHARLLDALVATPTAGTTTRHPEKC